MWHPPQGVHNFLRAYYHMKSADWTANKPFPLASNAASEQAKLPRYYVMDLDKGMAEQVASDMPTAGADRGCKWLTDEELKVYSSEYGRNGFQGGLQSYRVGRVPRLSAELQLFAGRTIDVPSLFLSGKSDWGVYQRAGSLDGDAARVHEVRRRGAGRRRRPLGAAGTRRSTSPIGSSRLRGSIPERMAVPSPVCYTVLHHGGTEETADRRSARVAAEPVCLSGSREGRRVPPGHGVRPRRRTADPITR